MPTPVKFVFLFHDSSGTGWTEVHYRLSSSDTPSLKDQLANGVDVIAQQRRLILGENCQIIGVRVSYKRAGVVASLSARTYLDGADGWDDVSPTLSLAVKFVDATGSRKKICHVRGFWDAVEANGEYHPEGGADGNWTGRFNDWKAALKDQQYGWMGQSAASTGKGTVTNYVTNPGGLVTFTLLPLTVALPPVDTITTIKFSRLNDSKSPLNTQIRVKVLSASTVQTIEPFASGPFTGAGTYTIRDTGFIVYNEVYAVSLGRRQQGRPLNQLPGRGPVRARY